MIRAENLVKSFGDRRVLDGVSLLVRPGEVTALVGPSGGGKSTLLRCLNGLETYTSGRVEVFDHVLPPTGDAPHTQRTLVPVRRAVGMVFQQFHLFPHLTVLENVMSGPVYALGRPAEACRAECLALLGRVGLEKFAGQSPARLSGGQQQRVAIARALAVHPRAVLFDEPTSALDPGVVGGGTRGDARPRGVGADDGGRDARLRAGAAGAHGSPNGGRARGRERPAGGCFVALEWVHEGAAMATATLTETGSKIIRVGHSPDPDDAFMFHALANDKLPTGNLKFVHQLEDIETLNRRALRGELEVSAVSIHAYASLLDQYALLPSGCSMGDHYGPMIVSKNAIEGRPTCAAGDDRRAGYSDDRVP